MGDVKHDCEAIGKGNKSRCRLASVSRFEGKDYCKKHLRYFQLRSGQQLSLPHTDASDVCLMNSGPLFMAYVDKDSYEPSLGGYLVDMVVEGRPGRIPSGPWPAEGCRCAWVWGPDFRTACRLAEQFNSERLTPADCGRILKSAGIHA
jgi:hypothetical protein